MSVQSASLIAIVLVAVLALALSPAVNRAPDVTATMITVAFLFVVHSLILNWIELTNGAGGMQGLTRLETRGPIYLGLVVAVVGARLFKSTRAGRFASASAEDELAAGAAGINLVGPRTWALLGSAVLVGVGASLRVQSLASISPSQFYFEFTLLTLAMLVVGGKRSVTAAVVGAVVITIGRRVSLNIAGNDPDLGALPEMFLGASILAAMLLRPKGLLGDWELDHTIVRLVRRFRPVPEAPLPEATPEEEQQAPSDVVVLRAVEVRVEFGGFVALDDVSVDARSDEVVGLIGPNGAGKTTLVNVVTGVVKPTAGHVHLGEHDLTGAAPYRIARAGIARTFQNLRLFSDLTVRENVAVTALSAARYRHQERRPDVDELVRAAGLAEMSDRKAGELDYGSSRRLELARAAALAPRFLLLDEPTSGMSDEESAAMIDHVRRTARVVDAGVLVIDHDLHFITNICDRIHVLDQGRLIASGTPAEIQRDPVVIAAYLGSRASGSSGTGREDEPDQVSSR
jgi:branched-chain amino acid transport system permease protein